MTRVDQSARNYARAMGLDLDALFGNMLNGIAAESGSGDKLTVEDLHSAIRAYGESKRLQSALIDGKTPGSRKGAVALPDDGGQALENLVETAAHPDQSVFRERARAQIDRILRSAGSRVRASEQLAHVYMEGGARRNELRTMIEDTLVKGGHLGVLGMLAGRLSQRRISGRHVDMMESFSVTAYKPLVGVAGRSPWWRGWYHEFA